MSDINTDPPEHTSPSVVYQRSSVCVPITVKPYATPETPRTRCCGEPYVTLGRSTCDGTKNGECVLTVTQEICIEIPVRFGANATPGDVYVNCISASKDDICSDCHTCNPKSMDI